MFGTSQVQSGLRLDRQLEIGSIECQTLGEWDVPQQNVLFLPPLTAGFQEAVGSRWGLPWKPESRSRGGGGSSLAFGNFSAWPTGLPGHRQLSGVSGRMAVMTGHPKGSGSRSFSTHLLLSTRTMVHRYQEPLSLSSRCTFACLQVQRRPWPGHCIPTLSPCFHQTHNTSATARYTYTLCSS